MMMMIMTYTKTGKAKFSFMSVSTKEKHILRLYVINQITNQLNPSV